MDHTSVDRGRTFGINAAVESFGRLENDVVLWLYADDCIDWVVRFDMAENGVRVKDEDNYTAHCQAAAGFIVAC